MSSRFVVVSFLGLGWAFYELSGGADFQPQERPELVADVQAEAPGPAPERTALESASANRRSKEVVPVGRVERPLANPDLRQQVARERLVQAGSILNSAAAFDNRIPTGGLQLVSLEGGLSAITSQPAAPLITTAERPDAAQADVRYVSASRVNMRQGPGTNYSVTARLLANDKVIVLEDNGTGWLRLKADNDGRVGWIAASLLTKKAP